MQKNKQIISLVAATCTVLAMVLLSACATTAPAPDDVIPKRAQARWDALLDGDFATAYSFYSPGYRSATTVVDFEIGMRMRKVQYSAAKYQDHSCEVDVCTVRLKVTYSVAKPVPGLDEWESESVVSEQWLKSDGEWWFLPQK